MASLPKKVWGSVSSRSAASASAGSGCSEVVALSVASSSTGAFDRLPIDVFVLILKILGPRETAKAGLVCRAWRLRISDDRLWIFFLYRDHHPWGDVILFAETCLRSGYPLRICNDPHFNYQSRVSMANVKQ